MKPLALWVLPLSLLLLFRPLRGQPSPTTALLKSMKPQSMTKIATGETWKVSTSRTSTISMKTIDDQYSPIIWYPTRLNIWKNNFLLQEILIYQRYERKNKVHRIIKRNGKEKQEKKKITKNKGWLFIFYVPKLIYFKFPMQEFKKTQSSMNDTCTKIYTFEE